jgi:branched-chain amino acid transport system permease protein
MTDAVQELFVNILLATPKIGAYTIFALGIVFIYRASKVLNLAHGAMAMVPAFLAYSVVGATGVAAATVIAIAAGALLGLAVERGVVRRLRSASPTAQTVGTVGVLGLLIAFAARAWGTTPVRGPNPLPDVTFEIGNSLLRGVDLGLLAIAIAATAGSLALFKYTDLGLAMRCAADNRRAAWLMGMDPDRTTAVAWGMAGAFAALGGLLLGASTSLHPYILSLQVLPAFVAALIGGLENVRGALVGAVIVGLVLGTVPVMPLVGGQVGAPELMLAVLAFVVMSMRGSRFSVVSSTSGEGGLL